MFFYSRFLGFKISMNFKTSLKIICQIIILFKILFQNTEIGHINSVVLVFLSKNQQTNLYAQSKIIPENFLIQKT